MTKWVAGIGILIFGLFILSISAQEEQVEKARFEETTKLRIRGWNILESFTHQSKGLPDKNRWFVNPKSPPAVVAAPGSGLLALTKTAAFAGLTAAAGADVFSVTPPPQEPVTPSETLWETVLFNETALAYIQSHYKDSDRLRKQEMARELNFPPGAVSVKMFWYPMKKDQTIHVQLWDWRRVPGGTKRMPANRMATACFATGSEVTNSCPDPKGSFYTLRPSEWPCDSCSPNDNYEVLLLVGMHVAAKTSPDWSWFTFWWRGEDEAYPRTNGDSWTCDNAQRQAVLPSLMQPWSNYSMNAADSLRGQLPEPRGPDLANCGAPARIERPLNQEPPATQYFRDEYRAVYNPFVEGVPEGGRRSNCLQCHARANTMSSAPKFFVPTDPDIGLALSEFEGHIRTDYVWSIAGYIGLTTPKK